MLGGESVVIPTAASLCDKLCPQIEQHHAPMFSNSKHFSGKNAQYKV